MNGIFVLIPIMVLGVAVSAIIASSIVKLQRMRLEEASLRAVDPGEMTELARQVADLQRELLEVQERLEFTERILTHIKEASGLPAPPQS